MKNLSFVKKTSVICGVIAAVCWDITLIGRIVMIAKGAEVSKFTMGLTILNAVCWSLVCVLWILEYRLKKQSAEQENEN